MPGTGRPCKTGKTVPTAEIRAPEDRLPMRQRMNERQAKPGDGIYMVTLDSGTVEYTDRDGFDTLCKVLEIGEGEAKKDE